MTVLSFNIQSKAACVLSRFDECRVLAQHYDSINQDRHSSTIYDGLEEEQVRFLMRAEALRRFNLEEAYASAN